MADVVDVVGQTGAASRAARAAVVPTGTIHRWKLVVDCWNFIQTDTDSCGVQLTTTRENDPIRLFRVP